MGLIKNQVKKNREVWFVRHAETAMNEYDVSRGWTDVPLETDTFKDLIALGEKLKGADGIYASNLLRTLQTAHCIALGSGAPILGVNDWLHTWNPGNLTGKPTDEVDPLLERMAIEEPYKTIKGGESFEQFKYRFLMGLIACLNSHPGKTLIFVAHGRNLAVLNAWKEMGYPDTLAISDDDLGYEDFEPGSAHSFKISCGLLV